MNLKEIIVQFTPMDNVKILLDVCTAEIEVKKSRFICTLIPVNSDEDASKHIAAVKKKYYDARHNCQAFVVGDNNEYSRSSDDGEPQGTAGKPMLEVLSGSGIHNVLAVVTRYFGGVLLGTGGLVKAYQGAVKEALEVANSCGHVATKGRGFITEISSDYSDSGKIIYLLNSLNLPVTDTVYGENVTVKTVVSFGDKDSFYKKIADLTSARAKITEVCESEYLISDNGIKFI